MRNWCTALLLSVAGLGHAAPPAKVEIAFDVLKDGSAVAEVADRLDHGGGRYRIEEVWKGKGILALRGEIRRSSQGSVTPDGLRPDEFTDTRTGRETTRAAFDWKARRLTQVHRGETRTRELPERTTDRLALLYGFAFAGSSPEHPQRFEVADGRGLSEQRYRVAGRERLRTPAGEFDTIRLERAIDGPGDRRVQIWLAREHGLLPVRIVVAEADGSRLDQVATRIRTP